MKKFKHKFPSSILLNSIIASIDTSNASVQAPYSNSHKVAPCVTQELEDLAMMQRYICPSKTVTGAGSGTLLINQANADATLSFGQPSSFDPFPFSSQFLLIIVPLGLLTLILVLIILCRKCSKSSI
uniref:Uncharacterized protein n=1 Tax=Ditylenchus dipsaci TaxID=166011 RepID=A0A915EAE1_9BILA